MAKESDFQAALIRKLRKLYPGCVILKNDANYLQGIPDLIMLWQDMWAALECKKADDSVKQANQLYYVTLLNRMSFAAFINPANESAILDELHIALGARGSARIS